MVFSVRIVNADLYSAPPLVGFDVSYSSFRESKVSKVPLIRIFGSTPNGQKTCMHVHGVFPYIYIPYDGSQPTDKYLKQFATSVDFAVHVSMGKASSSTRHVHNIVIVKARPYYGYHQEEREFMKISFYNPFIVSRVVDLLQNGAIMNKVFQPHESHIPYIQQMFMDYNLYGMNLLYASSVHFRIPIKVKQGSLEDAGEESVLQSSSEPDLSPSFSTHDETKNLFWTKENIPSHCVHGAEVERLSVCELEVDVKAEDILNQNDIGSNIGTSPGLAAIWQEERERRKTDNDNVPLTPAVSQDRGDLPLLEAESYYKEKIRELIAERDLLVHIPVQKDGREMLSGMLERTPSYHDMMTDNEPIVDQSIVQEIVESSQRSLPRDLESSTDIEMIKMLASLADEDDCHPSPSCISPNASLSNTGRRFTNEFLSGEEEAEAEEAQQEEEESILMSQQVWDDTDPLNQLWSGNDEDRNPLVTTEEDNDHAFMGSQVRASQFDLEGLDDSWDVSLPSENQIPQLDGVNDDDDDDDDNDIHSMQSSSCSSNTSRVRSVRTCKRLGMSSIRISKRRSVISDKNRTTNKKRQRTPKRSNGREKRSTNPPFSLHLSETTSSEGESEEEEDLQTERDNYQMSEDLEDVTKKTRKDNEPHECEKAKNKKKKKNSKLDRYKFNVTKPTSSSMGYQAIKSVVFAEYKKPRNIHRQFKNNDTTELTKLKNVEKKVDVTTLYLKGNNSQKEQKRSYNLRNTKPFSLEITNSTTGLSTQDNRLTALNSIVSYPKLEEQTVHHTISGGSHVVRDLKVVVHDVALSEKLRSLYVPAVNRRKRLEQSRPKKDLFSSSGYVTRTCNVPSFSKPATKRSPRKSPRAKRYGVLDVIVQTSPPKDVKVVATENVLPIRRSISSQLERVKHSPSNASYSFNVSKTMDWQNCNRESLGALVQSHSGIKRKSIETGLQKHAKKERLSLRLTKRPDCKSAKVAKKGITENKEMKPTESVKYNLTENKRQPAPCTTKLVHDIETIDNEGTLNLFGKNEHEENSPRATMNSPDGLSQDVTCIPSSPIGDNETIQCQYKPQQTDDTNDALFNMSFLSPRPSDSDTSNTPPSPFTPTLQRSLPNEVKLDDSCKSINARYSSEFPFVNRIEASDGIQESLNSLPIVGLSEVSEDEIQTLLSCQSGESQMKVRLKSVSSVKTESMDENPSTFSTGALVNRSGTKVSMSSSCTPDDQIKNVNISCQPNRTTHSNKQSQTLTSARHDLSLDLKESKIACLNALRQQCLLLENTKRALLGNIDDEETIENEKRLSNQDTHCSTEGLCTQDVDTMSSGSFGPAENGSRNSYGLFEENSSVKSSDFRKLSVIVPQTQPPTSAQLIESMEDYGIPQCRHQHPFYSNPDDVPETTMDVGGRLLKVQSRSVKNLLEFDTQCPVVGIRDCRQLLCAGHETSFLKACQDNIGSTAGFVSGIENNPRLRLAFMNDKTIAVTPCKIPPSPLTVFSWAQEKLMAMNKISKHNEEKTKTTAKEKKNLIDALKTNCGEQEKYNKKQGGIDTEQANKSALQELTSPYSLFSPAEQKFTFDEAEHENEGYIRKETSRPKSNEHLRADNIVDWKERFGPSTPSSQPSCILSSPQHSTPIIPNNKISPSQLPIITPIVPPFDKTPGKKTKISPVPVVGQTRRQLIPSQFKFVTPDAPLRRYVEAGSEIEGPSPINTGGYKVPQMNMQDNKPSHEVQHLTVLSIELHVRTRKDLRPDPEFDPICAIFYHVQTDSTRLVMGKNQVTGIICVDKDSVRLTNTARDESHYNLYEVSSSELLSSSNGSRQREKRPLLERSGVTKYSTQYVEEEKDLFQTFLQVIHKWDPDILIGYEMQMLSWGYLIQRALVFDLDLCKLLSRVSGSSSECNMDAENDKWGAAHTSELKIAGRIILNVWRLMRHEVALNTYTFENVAFHVLHERIPLFTYRSLSDWWDHTTDVHRWRTVHHYVNRCHGNVRILEQIDFIGRTSELARLFGILFYCVISRGTQFRVESMMLRISKPMNYVTVSPSPQQRSTMRAPEVIPLVLEPESRFYSDPVLVLDFQSLYPSMIIAYNYCYSTCLGRVAHLSETGEFKFGATSLFVPFNVLKKIEDDIHVSPNGVAFVKPTIRRGVLPKMLEDILNTRIMVKNSMKKRKSNKSVHRMLDARQLGLKLIANVTFGYTAAHFSGRMPCVEIGDSIIRKARETLEYAINVVNNTSKWGARVIYGDTDSMFVLLKGVTKEEAFRIGQDIVDTVTSLNPKPVKLKFEKVYLPCVLQTKKRYVGYMYETLDQKEPVFDAKGIETVRRDTCPAVAKVLEKSLRIMFETKDVSLVKKYVQRQFRKVMEGRVSLQDLTFAKEYRGMASYKPAACVPALELTRRMLKEDRRSEPRVGERVPYVVTYGTPGLPLIRLVRRPLEVLQDCNLRINAMYYITKQLIPPLNRAFSLIGVDVKTWFADVPRVSRVRTQPLTTDTMDSRKKTISHYFHTTNCPVCQQITSTGLCESCFKEPQKVIATLNDRIRNWEKTYHNVTQLCYQCCESCNSRLCCVSIDCPVLYKLVKSTHDLQSAQQLRLLLDGF